MLLPSFARRSAGRTIFSKRILACQRGGQQRESPLGGGLSLIHIYTTVQNLEGLLLKNRPDYKDAYREEKFLALLREANMNTILIAHQKNTDVYKRQMLDRVICPALGLKSFAMPYIFWLR